MSGYIDQEGNEVVPDPCGQRFHSCACSIAMCIEGDHADPRCRTQPWCVSFPGSR